MKNTKYTPSSTTVQVGRVYIEHNTQHENGPVIGFGTRIFLDGQELKGITKAVLTFQVDGIVTLDVETVC